jgi:8-amino-7-oxononanoate synthase
MRITAPTKVEIEGRAYTFFGGTNYLGLSFHPAVANALKSGVDQTGVGLGASRKTTGTSPELDALEHAAAAFSACPDAIAMTSGMAANIAVLEGLTGEIDTWLCDEQAHASFLRFVAITGASLVRYKHRDLDDFRRQLSNIYSPRLGVFTDAVFALTGAVAPLKELTVPNQLLVIDESHSFGVIGDAGRGLAYDCGIIGDNVVLTTTLSKAMGAMGGLILGGRAILSKIRERSSAFAASSALPPAMCAASMAALAVVQSQPQLIAQLRANCKQMWDALQGVPLVAGGPNVPIFCLRSASGCDVERIHARCKEQGFLLPLIAGYPGMPEGGMLRWIVQAGHQSTEIAKVCEMIRA